MPYPSYGKVDQSLLSSSNIVYYGPLDRSKEVDMILKKCEETNGTGLIIDENTIYEIDCECYRQMLKRQAKRKGQ